MTPRLITLAATAAALTSIGPARPRADDGCAFARGTTTCTTTSQSTETSTHVATAGCLYGPGGIPARRSLTFLDTYLVTVTTTTLAHGVEGPVYDTSTEVTRVLQSSTLISSVCELV